MWAGSPVLFPHVSYNVADGKEGQYRLNGTLYSSPQHGFGRRVPWRIADRTPTAVTMEITDSDATRPSYPFAFRYALTYRLERGRLHWHQRIENRDAQPLPFSAGFHPYLRLPDVPRAGWEVGLPARRHVVTDARGIPTGASEPVPASSGPLGDTTYDDGYDGLGEAPAFVLAGGGRRITTRFVDGFPVAQVYAPADADVICFEPMTAPVDALRTGDRLPVLGPGASLTAAFTITVG